MPVTAVEKSRNSKVGPIAVTYAAQSSCPKTCPFMGSGCYAEHGLTRMTTSRLNKSDAGAIQVAIAEAEAIRKLSGKRPLRLHIVGDCASPLAAMIVSQACREYSAKHGQVVYTYTHAWRDVPVECWDGVNVVASCERDADIAEAMAQGYKITAIVVPEHSTDKAYLKNGVKRIPCPSQTRGVACADCRLCFQPLGVAIEFAAHGTRKNTVALKVS